VHRFFFKLQHCRDSVFTLLITIAILSKQIWLNTKHKILASCTKQAKHKFLAALYAGLQGFSWVKCRFHVIAV